MIESLPTILEPVSHGELSEVADVTPEDRLASWLNRLGWNTRAAYLNDLSMAAARFGIVVEAGERAKWVAAGALLNRLCAMSRGRALTELEAYQAEMIARNLSSATINRRMAAVNSALRQIGKADIGPGRLDISSVKSERRKAIKAPTVGAIANANSKLDISKPLGIRDAAILRLAFERALRRAEISAMNVSDFDPATCSIRVKRKGKAELATIDIADTTCAALSAWLEVRATLGLPDDNTALFVGLGNKGRGRRLSGDGLYCLFKRLGESVGQDHWRPHLMRHASISEAYGRLGDIEAVREFAGHADAQTTSAVYIADGEKRKAAGKAVAKLRGLY